MLKRIKRLRSYRAHAQFIAELSEEPIGYLPRQTDIPSPYRYSPTEAVEDWGGRRVICKETAHRQYDVFEVPAHVRVYATDEEATAAHLRQTS